MIFSDHKRTPSNCVVGSSKKAPYHHAFAMGTTWRLSRSNRRNRTYGNIIFKYLQQVAKPFQHFHNMELWTVNYMYFFWKTCLTLRRIYRTISLLNQPNWNQTKRWPEVAVLASGTREIQPRSIPGKGFWLWGYEIYTIPGPILKTLASPSFQHLARYGSLERSDQKGTTFFTISHR